MKTEFLLVERDRANEALSRANEGLSRANDDLKQANEASKESEQRFQRFDLLLQTARCNGGSLSALSRAPTRDAVGKGRGWTADRGMRPALQAGTQAIAKIGSRGW